MSIRIDSADFVTYSSYFNEYSIISNLINSLKQDLPIGDLLANKLENPDVLMYQLPWLVILAGKPDLNIAKDLLGKIPPNLTIFVPNSKWVEILKEYWEEKLRFYKRTQFDSSNLQVHHLRSIVDTLPNSFSIRKVDKHLAQKIDKSWHPFIKESFGSYENFTKKGLGFCTVHKKKIASFALSLLPFEQDLEIQVATMEKFKKKGLGTIISAKLLECCLHNDITPHWDATNAVSARMAIKLGFSNPVPYRVYYWVDS